MATLALAGGLLPMRQRDAELRLPICPEIKQSISKPAVRHLHKHHWDEFLKCIVDLSGGAALEKLTQ